MIVFCRQLIMVCYILLGVQSTGADGKTVLYDFEEKINGAVFPGLQGGPHNMAVAGIAVAMKHAQVLLITEMSLIPFRVGQLLGYLKIL